MAELLRCLRSSPQDGSIVAFINTTGLFFLFFFCLMPLHALVRLNCEFSRRFFAFSVGQNITKPDNVMDIQGLTKQHLQSDVNHNNSLILSLWSICLLETFQTLVRLRFMVCCIVFPIFHTYCKRTHYSHNDKVTTKNVHMTSTKLQAICCMAFSLECIISTGHCPSFIHTLMGLPCLLKSSHPF